MIDDLYDLQWGSRPLVLSMPHSGTRVPDDLLPRLTPAARELPDTDWHIPLLYDFARELDVTILQANYSRYVIDLNRPPDNRSLYPGQAGSDLCPSTQFDGTPVYQQGEAPDAAEIEARRIRYWQPYHDQLASCLARQAEKHGYVILYDCHSIRSEVPRLFEGRLPDLNVGTANGASCAPAIRLRVEQILSDQAYRHVLDDRFIGGYITRHYGDPARGRHALQMELSQINYMQEDPPYIYRREIADKLGLVLKNLLQALATCPNPEND